MTQWVRKNMQIHECQETFCSTEGDAQRNLSLNSYPGEIAEVKETMRYMDAITNYALEEWQNQNRLEFEDGEGCINVDLLVSFFLQMRKEIHETKNKENSSNSKSTKIESKDADICGTDEHFGQEAQNEEALRLYFVILLHNLPLHTVAFKDSSQCGKQWRPENITLKCFFAAYAGCYVKLLGDRPNLAKWQSVTTKFLEEACQNGPDIKWTLDAAQCKRIAYTSTFQFACAVLQYKHFKA